MRTLDKKFVSELKEGGSLRPIVDTVINDPSLDFEIREGYINIYFKGNSILRLNENGKYYINEKFVDGTELPSDGSFSTKDYLKDLTKIKNNVVKVKSERPALEIEYEQLLIRSNNFNENVNSEIFITDRQFDDKKNKTRFDLSGFYWRYESRKKHQTVPLTFIEVKYSLNSDIAEIDQQIDKYYNTVKSNISEIAMETKYLKDLKIDLGLIKQPDDRLDAYKTLKISDKIDDVKFIIALIDYNPKSKLFKAAKPKLEALSYSNQIEIFNCVFAIWSDYLKKI